MKVQMRLMFKISIILAGIIAVLAAVPVGHIAEISISGCCGAPSNGLKGSGFILGGILGVVGIIIVILGIKFKRNRTI